jgi:RNA polymerase sigma factor (sigma-70 family)
MLTAEQLAEAFEQHRAHLRAVAYRMLGSSSEAEDAVQESWIRLGRTDVSGVENLRAWLTTVVARVCLDMLRTRTSRREDALDTHVPDPVITRADGDPESNAMRADSVGLALLVEARVARSRSYAVCRFIQNCGVTAKSRARRNAVSAVMLSRYAVLLRIVTTLDIGVQNCSP